jgi:SAM-dependent methyltransferase
VKNVVEKANYVLDPVSGVWISPVYEGITYSDGDEVETRIGSIIENALDVSVFSTELREFCVDWPSLYHLSSTRANVLRPFEPILNGDVLEIGAGCGAISRYLGERGLNVLALEGSPRRAAIARSRTRDLESVTVLAEKFDQFQCAHQFDVITLIGVLEYASLFTAGDNPHLAMLDRVRSLLKPDGKLIVAIENQLGLKYFAGAPEDHHSLPMYGVEGRYRGNEAETFGHQVLLGLLAGAGLPHCETLAPFPDYKMPISVITEEGASASDFDAAALAWQSVRKDPQLPETTSFSLELAWPVITRNSLTIELANSFLVVASKKPGKAMKQGCLAFHYSTDRAPAYCKETIFSRDRNGAIALACHLPSGNKGEAALERGKLSYRHPDRSVYVLGVPLSYRFVEIVASPGWSIQQCLEYFSNYLDILLACLQSEGSALTALDRESVLPGDYLDATPANIIIDRSGVASLVDREWYSSEGVPLDYLLFRSIMSLLGSVSRFAAPADGEPTSRGGFALAIMGRLGFSTDDKDIAGFLELESDLAAFSSGSASRRFLTWSPEQTLPGLAASAAVTSLEARLNVTLEAKENAEKWAYSHLAEVQRLQLQLTATEDAKAAAESLAYSRAIELNRLQARLATTVTEKEGAEALAAERRDKLPPVQSQLDDAEAENQRLQGDLTARIADLAKIRQSAGYKLLAALGLVPKAGGHDD